MPQIKSKFRFGPWAWINKSKKNHSERYKNVAKIVPILCPILTTSVGPTNVTISWGAIPMASGYEVIIYTDAGGSSVFATLNIPSSQSSCSYSGLESGTQYWIRVNPINGTSKPCGLATVTTEVLSTIPAVAWLYNLGGLLSHPIGTAYTIRVEEPGFSYFVIANYTTVEGDNVQTVLASKLNDEINQNILGYTSEMAQNSSPNDSFKVTAREGLGALMNGKSIMIEFEGGSTGAFFQGGA